MLLALLTPSERELLRCSTLFEQPVPLAVLEAMAQALALNAGTPTGRRLLALGLWDAVEDRYQPSVTAVTINALVKPRIALLTDADAAQLAPLALPTLWTRWGGKDAVRPPGLDVELARLAILGNQVDILRLTAQSALEGLIDAFRYPEAAALAQQALQT